MMIALYVQMENTAVMAFYKAIATQGTSVISELLLGVMKIKYVQLVTTVRQELYYQYLVQLHFSGRVQVPKMFHLASLVKLGIIVLIMITYLAFVQEAISVLKKQKNQSLALWALTIRIKDKELHHCACHVLQAQLA